MADFFDYRNYIPGMTAKSGVPTANVGAEDQMRILQQMKMAEMLRQQGATPLPQGSGMVRNGGGGQWAAPDQAYSTFGESLGKLGSSLAGGWMEKNANDEAKAYAEKLKKQQSDEFKDVLTKITGTSATEGVDATGLPISLGDIQNAQSDAQQPTLQPSLAPIDGTTPIPNFNQPQPTQDGQALGSMLKQGINGIDQNGQAIQPQTPDITGGVTPQDYATALQPNKPMLQQEYTPSVQGKSAVAGLTGMPLAMALMNTQYNPELKTAGLEAFKEAIKPAKPISYKLETRYDNNGNSIQEWVNPENPLAPHIPYGDAKAPTPMYKSLTTMVNGQPMKQDQVSIDGGKTWKLQGDAIPAYAKQVVNVNAQPKDQYSNIQPDGKGGMIGFNKDTKRMELIPMEGDAESKITGGGAGAGGREATQINRMIIAGKEAVRDVENIAREPITASTGMFGSMKRGGNILSAPLDVLANKITSQEVQTYKVKSAGLIRSLATIEAVGLMPSGALVEQMKANTFEEGDTYLTKIQKLAQTRQIVEAANEAIQANPRVSQEQKDFVKKISTDMEKAVPYTHQDIDNFNTLSSKNPKLTLQSYLNSKTKAQKATSNAPSGIDAKTWAHMTDEEKALWH